MLTSLACPCGPTLLQSNAVRGSPVTVLANATELFSNLDASMPKFSDWLQQGMGINSSATLEVNRQGLHEPQPERCPWPVEPWMLCTAPLCLQDALNPCGPPPHACVQEYGRLWMPMPSNTTNGYDSHVVCTMHYGYTYFLQIMFIILCVIVLFQVRSGGGQAGWGQLRQLHGSQAKGLANACSFSIVPFSSPHNCPRHTLHFTRGAGGRLSHLHRGLLGAPVDGP